ncbi:hypothetical protein [Flavobacterium sp.]|uniref:hypothetical protein n=1 Tax=Flavobacterium sp. TaxID=239 RepID=UPI0026110828|nr:hypothetical protein [Flavobacterium sp.]
MNTLSAKRQKLSMDDLIRYPEGSLGFNLGQYLHSNSIEPDPVPDSDDILRVLLTKNDSITEEIGMHYYLFGNGGLSIRMLFIMVSGLVLCPLSVKYFYKRYRDGKNALRFYDLNHFGFLPLPVTRIKDAFMIP